jgi:hypothetical protein
VGSHSTSLLAAGVIPAGLGANRFTASRSEAWNAPGSTAKSESSLRILKGPPHPTRENFSLLTQALPCACEDSGYRQASRYRWSRTEHRYPHFQSHFALLLVLCSRATVTIVRFFAIILIALLLPLSMRLPSATACSTTACCGPNCSLSAPVNQLSCCNTLVAPDRAKTQTQGAQHFDSTGSMPAAVATIAISRLRNTVFARGYSPPDRLASLALLCSRQI